MKVDNLRVKEGSVDSMKVKRNKNIGLDVSKTIKFLGFLLDIT